MVTPDRAGWMASGHVGRVIARPGIDPGWLYLALSSSQGAPRSSQWPRVPSSTGPTRETRFMRTASATRSRHGRLRTMRVSLTFSTCSATPRRTWFVVTARPIVPSKQRCATTRSRPVIRCSRRTSTRPDFTDTAPTLHRRATIRAILSCGYRDLTSQIEVVPAKRRAFVVSGTWTICFLSRRG